jgi:hypothetical protein
VPITSVKMDSVSPGKRREVTAVNVNEDILANTVI